MTIEDFMRVHNTRVFRTNVIFRFVDSYGNMQDVTEKIFQDDEKWYEIVTEWYGRAIDEITYLYSNNNIIIRIEVE